MKRTCPMFITSVAVFGFFISGIAFGAKGLTAQSFPQTFADVPFTKKLEVKKAGYEPYKDMRAYVIPDFKDTDDNFKKQMCERDHEECCRRWPDYKGCQPQIGYELFDGDKSKCTKQSAPESYQTNVGANITCIPTRKHSKFVAWCKDAGLKDCAPTQTIAVGEKDDKFFYAKWKCEAPYEPKLNACVCHDSNMDEDDNCQCNGAGMGYDTTTKKCYCVANDGRDPSDPIAHIENKKCVCNDPNMDIWNQCLTVLTDCRDNNGDIDPNQEIVTDGAGNQSCACKDTDKMELDTSTGKCKCKNGADITLHPDCDATTPPPPASNKHYVFKQCQPSNRVGDWNSCGGYTQGHSRCFTQCHTDANSSYPDQVVNKKIERITSNSALAYFCTGYTRRGSNNDYFVSINTSSGEIRAGAKKIYTQSEADLITEAIKSDAPGEEAPPFAKCTEATASSSWYIIKYEYDLSSGAETEIEAIKIAGS